MRFSENAQLVAHSQLVMSNIDALVATTFETESAQRAYVLTGEEPFAAEYTRAMGRVDGLVQQLRDAVSTDPAQLARVEPLAEAVRARMQQQRGAHRICAAPVESKPFSSGSRRAPQRPGVSLQARIRTLAQEMKVAEIDLLNEREHGAQHSARVTQMVIVGGSGLALIFVSLALYAIRRDFAGRARAEAELNRFFDLSIDMFVIASPDGHFKRMSPAVTDMLGYTIEEALALDYMEMHASRRSRPHRRGGGRADQCAASASRISNRGSATRMAPTACCRGARSRAAASCTPPRATSPMPRAAAQALREAKEQLEERVERAHARARRRQRDRCARASGAFAR